MAAIALLPKLWLPQFEPWRLLRPLKMDGQFMSGQRLQFIANDPGVAAWQSVAGISQVGDTVLADVPEGGSTSSVSVPSGLQENDILLVFRGCDDPGQFGGSPDPISGYTEIARVDDANGGANCSLIVEYKPMGVTPDSSITVPQHSGVQDSNQAVIVRAYRGVDTSTPIDATATIADGSSGAPDPPSYTTVTDDALRFAVGFQGDDLVAGSVSPPSGWGDLSDNEVGTSGDGGTVMLATLAAPSAGTVNPAAFTAGNDEWAACHFALRPA